MKKEFPILEFDNSKKAVIEPKKIIDSIKIPKNVVICFFNDVIEQMKDEKELILVKNLKSEMGYHPVYKMSFNNQEIAIFNPGVGAPLAAGLLEEVIALGGKKFIACGGAGVLNREISVGHIIVPNKAIRDEGTSYHYIKPEREICVNEKAINAIELILKKHKCSYLLAKTWTTDAMYRETVEKVNLRKEEGCLCVEMECSALCAVSEFRQVIFGQILYGGDDVSCEEWDSRNWKDRSFVRKQILKFAIEACLEI